ncbi:MAG: hypothetical protein M0R06_00445 [Sphaerochaeta sp.]|nr:hypothetical protein [Sphaerochaeta sp.]
MQRLDIKKGERFGRLVIIAEEPQHDAKRYFLCQCDCGKRKEIALTGLTNGTQSCGCLQREATVKRNLTHGDANTTLYRRWGHIIGRCLNPSDARYPYYGGRGITVCQEWLKFEAFRDWALANGYAENLTIDRKENDGNYEPSNCRWVSWKEQQNNRRNNHRITCNGITLTLQQWSEKIGIKSGTLLARIESGWSPDIALTTPLLRQGESS